MSEPLVKAGTSETGAPAALSPLTRGVYVWPRPVSESDCAMRIAV